MIASEDRQTTLDLVADAVKAGARQSKACAVLEISERTLQRWQRDRPTDKRQEGAAKRCPANKLSLAERERILAICNETEHQSLPPSQIVPRLADKGDKGVYVASESSMYRVLRDAKQVNRRGRSQAPRTVAKPTSYQATAPNQVWSWDITYLASSIQGRFHRLYLVMDVYSRKIVGWEVHDNESAEHASTLIQKACLAEATSGKDLVLHAENGGPMKGATMLATLQRLGVVPSFSRPAVSDDNPYSESLFKTLKYRPGYPSKPFADLTAARLWVRSIVRWYNTEHRHSSIKYVTPDQRHRGTDAALLARRTELYATAKQRHPERWSGSTRSWRPIKQVWLNPSPDQVPSGEISTAA